MELKLLDNRKCPCGEGTDITSELEAQAKLSIRQVVEMFEEARGIHGQDWTYQDQVLAYEQVIEQLRGVSHD